MPFIVQIRIVQEKLWLDEDWQSKQILSIFALSAGSGTLEYLYPRDNSRCFCRTDVTRQKGPNASLYPSEKIERTFV